MRVGFLIFFLGLSVSLLAEVLVWHEGAVVLENDKVLAGEISVKQSHDLILFRATGLLTVYPAHRLKSFHYYDVAANINRKFVSLTNSNNPVRRSCLYELVVRGEVSVLRKARRGLYEAESYSDKDDFDYFIWKSGVLTSLTNFRTLVFPELMNAYHDQIVLFIHNNRLDPNLPDSAIRIIEFFNKRERMNAFAENY